MVSPSRCPPWQPERPGPTRREPRRAQRSYTTRRDTIRRRDRGGGLTVFLKSQGEIFDAVEPFFDDVNRRQEVVDLAADLAARWPDLEPTTKRQIFERLVSRINLTQETLEIRIAPSRLLEILWEEDNPKTFEPALWDNELTVTFTVPAHLKRAGMETRLLIEGADGSARKSPDRSLLRLLSQAQRFHEMVLHNRGRTMTELAIEAGVGGSYFTRILRLSFLAPVVVKTILGDRHPLELTANKLAGDTRLPIAWEEQRARFGIA